jgi:uncharacterized membrane protein
MNEMLVAVFDTEDAAVKGMQTLKDLHQEGGLSLYAWALIVRERDGAISVKQQSVEAPLGAALGLLMGGIAGIVGGPAGSAVGASLGAYIGVLADWARAGIDLKFLDDAGKTLGVGKAAVLAEIEESWTSLLEPRLREQGGIVFRRFRTDVLDDQLLQESIALERALEALENKLDIATTVNRDELQKGAADVKQRLKAIQDRAKTTIDLKKAETDLKVKALLEQAETAAEEAKSQVRKRISDAQTDFEMRSKKLNQAWSLAKKALAPTGRSR